MAESRRFVRMCANNFKMSLPAFEQAWRAISAAILLGGLNCCLPTEAWAGQSVKLGWVQSTDPTVTGYKIYYGGTSGHYTNIVDVGNKTLATISNLVEGRTYYFVATAYTVLGMESLPSNELAYKVPTPSVPVWKLVASQIQSTAAGKVFSLTSTTNGPSSWELEASTDLATWKAVSQGTNSPVNVAVAPSSTHKRFYRLKSNLSGVSLATRKVGTNEFPGSFYITTTGPAPASWTVETSADFTNWSTLATGSNTPVNVAVVASTAPAMFFRLKGK
jgi:hypothetical protein